MMKPLTSSLKKLIDHHRNGKGSKYSKGFFPEIVIQDFPIRGHKVFLHIRRRRWLNTETSKVIYRNWTLVEKGTRMTGEFAAFLKEINRYSPE
jgi:hypothetical protein